MVGLPDPERIVRDLWPLLSDTTKVSANLLQEPHVRRMLAEQPEGSRDNPEKVRAMILKLCEGRFLTLQQLSQLLDRNPAGLRARLLAPMVKAHHLEWRYPTNPNHEQQAYRTVLT